MAAVPSLPVQTDADAQETQEWLDALSAVIQQEGPERAHYLIEKQIELARAAGVNVAYSANTAYVNTIPPDQEVRSPGDHALENRIRSYVRWNALAMVLRANKGDSNLGGHIASFASAATLYDVGFNHFWHAPTEHHGGDMVYVQGHSSPGIYARAFMLGRLTEEQMDHFRREVDGKGAVVVSASVADAGLLAVPDRVHGAGADHGHLPGALHEIPARPRHRQHREPQDLVLRRRRRGRRTRDTRRHRHGRAREPRQPSVRGQLQPATPRRSGARQQQDHPGTGGEFPRCRLERAQGDLGQLLGPVAGARPSRALAQAHGRVRRRRLPDLQGARRRVCARAFLRQIPGDQGAGRELVGRRHLAPEPRRPRPAQGLRRLYRSHEPQGPTDGDSGQDREGLRHGRGRRGAEHHPSTEEDGHDLAAGVPQPLQAAAHRRAARTTRLHQARQGFARVPIHGRTPHGARRFRAIAPTQNGSAGSSGAVYF